MQGRTLLWLIMGNSRYWRKVSEIEFSGAAALNSSQSQTCRKKTQGFITLTLKKEIFFFHHISSQCMSLCCSLQ
ncbi:hypothetical protein LDENG_00185410 [Lucifuga dentata]|nr:hypothetical protein LDENG_00185410 [Lucifuga dentata]